MSQTQDTEKCPVEAALALVDAGPLKTPAWLIQAEAICCHCHRYEDVSMAAARILAAEVRRLRALTPTPTEEEARPACNLQPCNLQPCNLQP